MLPVEILMFITQVCISPTSLDKDVQNSVNCNQYMIQCMEIELKTSRLPVTGVAFSRCLVQYELDRK